jgi:BRCT domain type II-containing protein
MLRDVKERLEQPSPTAQTDSNPSTPKGSPSPIHGILGETRKPWTEMSNSAKSKRKKKIVDGLSKAMQEVKTSIVLEVESAH